MTPIKPTKRKRAKKDYRISVNFDERTGDGLRADAERMGIGVVNVVRIAATEYLERRSQASN